MNLLRKYRKIKYSIHNFKLIAINVKKIIVKAKHLLCLNLSS